MCRQHQSRLLEPDPVHQVQNFSLIQEPSMVSWYQNELRSSAKPCLLIRLHPSFGAKMFSFATKILTLPNRYMCDNKGHSIGVGGAAAAPRATSAFISVARYASLPSKAARTMEMAPLPSSSRRGFLDFMDASDQNRQNGGFGSIGSDQNRRFDHMGSPDG